MKLGEFEHEYDLEKLQLITLKAHDFPMMVTPRFANYYMNNLHEPFTSTLLSNYLGNDTLFIDIGAHYGYYTLLAGSMHPGCQIISFEPVPENFEILRRNVELNQLTNVTIHNIALSDKDETKNFNIAEASDCSGFYDHPLTSTRRVISVPAVTLDSMINVLPGRVIIKIDTEGHELNVLSGMENTIINTADVKLIIEFNPKCLRSAGREPVDLLDKLIYLGLDIYFIDDDNRLTYKIEKDKIHKWPDFLPETSITPGVKTYANLLGVKSNKSLSVCFFSHSAQLAGSERSLMELVTESIRDHGFVCSVILPGDGPLKSKLEAAGAATLLLPYLWWGDTALLTSDEINKRLHISFKATLHNILERMLKINPDIIFTNTMVIPWGAVTALFLSKPHVWFVREFGTLGTDVKFFQPLDSVLKFIKDTSDLVLTNSDIVRKTLFGEVTAKNILTVNMHINIPAEAVDPGENQYFKRVDSAKLIICGHVVEAKGQKDAVLAVKELINRRISVELVLMGDDSTEYASLLKKTVKDEGLDALVQFIGFQENPYQALNQADIVLVCSQHEGFGRVALEAMLLKKPVIGTDSGGTPELVSEGYNGLLYSAGNHIQLADKIEYLLEHTDKMQQYGNNGYEYACDRFTKAAYGGKISALLQRLKEDTNPVASHYFSFISNLVNGIFIDLENKTCRVEELDTALHDRDAKIVDLNVALQVKNIHIGELNAALLAKNALIQQIMSGFVMRTMTAFKLVVEKIIPPGTAGNRLYQLAIRGMQIITNEDFGRFRTKFKNWRNYNAIARGYCKDVNSHIDWTSFNEPTIDDLRNQSAKSPSFRYRPKISIVMPVWNTDARWLKAAINSLFKQTYDNWELCITDGGSTKKHVRNILEKYSKVDIRVKVKYLSSNGGIAVNSNEALKQATGEYIGFLDHDDELAPHALYEVVKLLNTSGAADIIYSDEDKIDESGNRFQPFFKPDWSPDLLNSYMYIGHFSVYKKDLIHKCGGFRPDYDFAQDYDLALRATEIAKDIRHIHIVLYHWRAIPDSAASSGKKFARSVNMKAVESAVKRHKYNANVIPADMPFWINRIQFNINEAPPISIVIPSENKNNAAQCIDNILLITDYPAFEILCVTDAVSKKSLYPRYITDARVRIIDTKDNDYAAKCNLGASFASGDNILFLNECAEALECDWLREMVGLFQRPEVGAVGALTLNTNGTVKSAGQVTGDRGLVSSAFSGEMQDSDSYFCFIQCTRNVSALDCPCIMVSNSIFRSVGGFDNLNTPVIYAAADLCFRIREKGYLLVYTPYARIKYSREMPIISTASRISVKEHLYLIKRWSAYIAYDPYFPHNMRTYLKADNRDLFKFIPALKQTARNNGKGNILLVSHDLSLSGAPILLYNIADYLLKQGYYITVISPAEGPLSDKFIQSGIPVIIDTTMLRNPSASATSLLSGYDLVIANTILTRESVRLAKQNNVASVWLIHESEFGRKMAEADADIAGTFDLADLVIFSARYTADLYAGFSHKHNFEIIYNGIAEPEIKGRPIEKDGGKFYVLHAGSIEPRKGQDILARCILDLQRKMAGVFEFYFAGRNLDKKYGQQLHRMIGHLNNVHFLGELEYAELTRYFQMADAFVLSSNDEVFPLTILQAMAQSKAMVTTSVGGIPEIIEDGVDGIVIPPKDPQALTAALMRLYEEPNFKHSLEINARNKFVSSFTLDKYGDTLLRAIQQRVEKIGIK